MLKLMSCLPAAVPVVYIVAPAAPVADNVVAASEPIGPEPRVATQRAMQWRSNLGKETRR